MDAEVDDDDDVEEDEVGGWLELVLGRGAARLSAFLKCGGNGL